jgi:two-component system, NarL family, sensor kinase
MENESHIAMIIVFSCLAMCIFAWAIILFVVLLRRRMIEKGKLIKQMELEKKMMLFKAVATAEEREREKIAGNLHDEINAMLAIHKQTLEKHGIDFDNNEFDMEAYNKTIEGIENIREAVTACAFDLVPAFFVKHGLLITLEDQIRQINYAGKIKARFNCLVKDHQTQFPKNEELNIYRISLELINNLLKHAQPGYLTMTVSNSDENLLIYIDHDGKKIGNTMIAAYTKRKDGLGLKSIQARSMMLNAKIEYSEDLTGPAISISIPFKAAEINK